MESVQVNILEMLIGHEFKRIDGRFYHMELCGRCAQDAAMRELAKAKPRIPPGEDP